jgi:EpsD family peptidyl-prolyl cis-trans isomerase
MIKRIRVLSMLTAVVMVLCSCGKPDIRKTSSRIAPRVNGEQISIYQIDSVLAPNSSMMPAQAGRAAALARQRLGDQELLAQEALQARLDRDAQVAQAIEHAKRQVLAQAYIERAVISASQASPEEIRKFYEGNPALFEQRRTYRVLEVVVVVPPEQFGILQDTVAGAKNLAEVVRWLDSRKLSFEASESSRAAEQIPMNILRRLFEMRDGQIAVFPMPHGVSVIQLEQSAEAALSEKQARPAIARYLLNLKRLELAQAAVTKLRERTKIDFDGIEPGRPTTVAQAAEQVQPQVAGPGMTHNTTDFARLR